MPDQVEWPRAVRTTMRPDDDVQIDEREYASLRAQGVLTPDSLLPEHRPIEERADPETPAAPPPAKRAASKES